MPPQTYLPTRCSAAIPSRSYWTLRIYPQHRCRQLRWSSTTLKRLLSCQLENPHTPLISVFSLLARKSHLPDIPTSARLQSRAALRRAQPSLADFRKILPLDGADAVFAYTIDEARHVGRTVFNARMFSPLDGIVEDPATGSAAAATAALLATLDLDAGSAHTWQIHQGVDMGRPSVLYARTLKINGVLDSVHIAGNCVAMMNGTFELAG